MRAFLVFVLLFTFTVFGQATAQQSAANASLSEQEIENRAHKIGESLRCVVCQNQSIDESNAPLAADMRVMVRERIRGGDTNEQVITFMRDRYGDFVLLKPPLQANTVLLWLAPFFLLVLFLVWYVVQAKRKRMAPTASPLSDEEQQQFQKLSQNQGGKS